MSTAITEEKYYLPQTRAGNFEFLKAIAQERSHESPILSNSILELIHIVETNEQAQVMVAETKYLRRKLELCELEFTDHIARAQFYDIDRH